MFHRERHRNQRIGWLRATVMGANDGIVSTASLISGIAAAGTSHQGIVLAGAAGVVAGAMSMACGEYVSVGSQADTERADLDRERGELVDDEAHEIEELTEIYQQRGLDPQLAERVARQLMAHDALGAHARDELGIHDLSAARPLQAALASAASFAVGAALPLVLAALAPLAYLTYLVPGASLALLAALGGTAATLGGARVAVGTLRVTFWGALAMGLTMAVGALFAGTLG